MQKGAGLSERKIARQLGISRNTVNKYLNISEFEIAAGLTDTDKSKKLEK
ncbi:helix-turn-helix domain-containing protein [Nitrosomonas communis]